MESTHFRFPCPNCQHALKVRREYVGRDVQCKHCSVTFRVVVPDDRALRPDGEVEFQVETVAPPPAGPKPRPETVTVARSAWEEAQQQVRSLTAERVSWQERARRIDALTAELEAAREEAERWRDAAAKADELEAESARLREELEGAQAAPPTAGPSLPEGMIAVAAADWEQLQAELREAREREPDAGKIEVLEAENTRLREELETLRAAPVAGPDLPEGTIAVAAAEWEQLHAELREAREREPATANVEGLEAENGRLREELETLRATAREPEPSLPEGMIAVAAVEWEQLQAALRDAREREPVAPLEDESLQAELDSARSEATALRDKLAAAEAASERNAARAASVAELEEENRLLVAGQERLAQQVEKLQDELRRVEQAASETALPDTSVAVDRAEWQRIQESAAALQSVRGERDAASARVEALADDLEAAHAEQEALRTLVANLKNDLGAAHARAQEDAAAAEERDSLRAELERATGALAAARQAEEQLGQVQSEHEELHAERDRLAEEISGMREQATAADSLRERLSVIEREHDALRDQHASQASLADELRRQHDEARERHEAAQADWDREREDILQRSETDWGEQRSRLEAELADARAELERVRAEADDERGALTRQVADLSTDSDRWKTVLEASARRIEQLVRDQEAQLRQRREVESALQRLEEAQREELGRTARTQDDSLEKLTALNERNEALAVEAERLREELAASQRAQEDLAAERARAIELLHASQTEQALHVQDLERQLDDAVCAKAEFAPESDEAIQARADLVSAREKIKELTELLESSEEERMGMQATLRSLGIRVH